VSAETRARLPAFDDLPEIPELGLRHAWNVLDADLGTIGLLGPEDVCDALTLVRHGETICLTVPLDAVDPPMYERESLQHSIFQPDRNTWDDRLDRFFLQAATHWDGLRHIQAREFGHFGGAVIDGRDGRSHALGIDGWARRGIVGRGVLLDVQAYAGFDPFVERSVEPDLLDEVAQAQGVEINSGDVLCLRFGWMDRYAVLPASEREAMASSHEFAGLGASEETARWLWDRQVVAVAADNPGVEVSPGDRAVGSLHRRLIPMLGLALGELFDFATLAEACRRDGHWAFLFVSVPLHLRGGVGSPANALAIR
jgi:kynurenine formamidase